MRFPSVLILPLRAWAADYDYVLLRSERFMFYCFLLKSHPFNVVLDIERLKMNVDNPCLRRNLFSFRHSSLFLNILFVKIHPHKAGRGLELRPQLHQGANLKYSSSIPLWKW